MKRYIVDESGMNVHDGLIEKSEKFDKSITTLGGDGEWKSLYGVRLQVDPTGVVIKGPDIFIGRLYEDLKNLNYNDVFTTERSVMRATGATNKSFNPDDPNDEIEKANVLKETKDWLEKTLKIRKAEKANMYTKDPLYTVNPDL